MFHSDRVKRQLNRKAAQVIKALLLMSLTTGLLCGCSASESDNTAALDSGSVNAVSATGIPATVTQITDADIAMAESDASDAVMIDLNSIDSDEYRITEGGTYILTGSMNGTLTVAADENLVNLVLKNAYIDSVCGPALRVESAAKVIITVAGDNTLKDSAGYMAEDEADGCISSECDISFNGSGKLSINGFHKDAIRCRDRVRILGGNISIIAKRSGIKANDGILICNSNMDIQTEKDALVTTKNGKNNKGLVEIIGSNVSIISGSYGINSKTDILIYDSVVTDKSVLGHYLAENQAVIEEGALQ